METLSAIDDFIIEKKLHDSEWGELYEVRPRNLRKRKYALKLAKEGVAEQRLDTERKVLEKLGGHPNITEIYFTGELAGRPYIVEELAETSLRAVLDAKKLSFDEALHIIKQAIEATKYAHSKDIIHRDLKPENILLSVKPKNILLESGKRYYDVAICDFGLATSNRMEEGVVSSLDDAASVAGTVQYLSPEQKSGGKVDKRTDLYTIGLVFYEMLTGEKPTINLPRPTEVRSDLPKWVDDFILHALKPNPADRFQTAEEMLAAIKMSTETIEPVPPSKLGLAKAAVTKKIRSGISYGGTALKHILLCPLYIAALPFFLGHFIMEWNGPRGRILPEEIMFVVCLGLGGLYYFVGVPIALEYNLKRVMAQQPARGTILYYNHRPGDKDNGRGFTFVDARKLPEISKIFIATPEITTDNFRPKYTLSEDGQIFYYTTPEGLVRINLMAVKAKELNYREIVVRSEVFNYFSELAFINGQLHAKLNNETWMITPEGRLQQTTNTLPPQSITVDNGNYEIDYDSFPNGEIEVQFKSSMPGNFNLGPSSQLHSWLPQTICLFDE